MSTNTIWKICNYIHLHQSTAALPEQLLIANLPYIIYLSPELKRQSALWRAEARSLTADRSTSPVSTCSSAAGHWNSLRARL